MTSNDLLKINVNDHTEKKNNLTYLSWAWAWAEALKADPAATFKVEMYTDEHGMVVPYMSLGNSFMVWVTVTVFGKPITCQLPVLDYRNKCVVDPNAFDVNTSIMRCLVKGIALHGLGLYIYAGEDLPETDAVPVEKTESQRAENQRKVVKVETPTATATVELNEANMALFADGMIEYVDLCKSETELKSYWKNNQTQIDLLKTHRPDLYANVLGRFTQVKSQFTKKD
jgi:hypothetical protein